VGALTSAFSPVSEVGSALPAACRLPRGRIDGRHIRPSGRIDDDGLFEPVPSTTIYAFPWSATDGRSRPTCAAARLFEISKKRFSLAMVARRPAACRDLDRVCRHPRSGARFSASCSFCACSLVQERRVAGQPLERGHGGQVVGALQVRMSIRLCAGSRTSPPASHQSSCRYSPLGPPWAEPRAPSTPAPFPFQTAALVFEMNRLRIFTPLLLFAQRMLPVRPYSSSSTNSTHLKFQDLRVLFLRTGRAACFIFQARVNTPRSPSICCS